MAFTVFNSYDGSSTAIPDSGLITLNVGKDTLLGFRDNTAIDAPAPDSLRVVNGGQLTLTSLGVLLVADFGDPSKYNVTFSLTVVAQVAGTIHTGVVFVGNTMQQFGLTLIVRDDAIAAAVPASAVEDLPEGYFDVQVNYRTRAVKSSILPVVIGLKVGDDYTFAIVPTLDSGFVTDIDSITLAIRPAGKFTGDPLEIDNDASPSVAGSGAGQHYALAFTLDDDALARWFEEQNALQEDAEQTADPNKLLVAAEIRFTKSGKTTTSDTFNFYLLQSIVAPSD